MPLAAEWEVAKFIHERGPYRLACRGMCLRDDYDGVRELPTDWVGIEETQSLRDALSVFDDDEEGRPDGYSLLDWETHTGYCPNCKSEAEED
ncbi:MAG: hypothetical protein U0791_26700 [Gemmataceae bacterium]